MFPHYFDTDITAALPWMILGFILGALLVALMRWMSGGGSKVKATIQSLHDELSNARLETSKLTTDNGFLNSALADAEKRAGTNTRFADENARLARSESEALNRAATLSGELERARADLQSYNARGTSLESEVQRLRAENSSLKTSWDQNAHQFNVMRSDLAAAEAKIRDFDLIRLKLEAAEKQMPDSAALRAELQRVHAERQSLLSSLEQNTKTSVGDANALVAAEQEIMRLKASLNEAGAQLNELAALRSRLQAVDTGARAPAGDSNALAAAQQEVSRYKTQLHEAGNKLREYDYIKLQLASAEKRANESEALASEVEKLRAECATLRMAEEHRAEREPAYSDASAAAAHDRLKADLAAANAALAAVKADLEKVAAQGPGSGGGRGTGEYHAIMTDLTATRNLSIVQAKELQHLRSEVARLNDGMGGDGGSSGISYADAPMAGRYTDRPLVSTRSGGVQRSKLRGGRPLGGVEGELAMLRAKVEQLSTEADELRRLTRKDG